MADRYQDRPYSAADDDDRGEDPHAAEKADSDPLAELARLIGQTDPFGTIGRANLPLQPRATNQYQEQYREDPAPADEDVAPAPGPPPWMQRAHRTEAAPQDYERDFPAPVHPLKRYATPVAAPAPEYQQPQFAEEEQESDPSRYDEALYGQLATGEQEPDPAYSDDAYAYQDGYDEATEAPPPKRHGTLMTVAAVLALAMLGTGGAFAYRTYVVSPRSGEPPIIRADAGPTKIIPTPSDGSGKVPDRMAAGDGTEKIVPREEAPVDVNPKPGPRVVLPQMNPNGAPPIPAATVTPPAPTPAAASGVMPNAEPRKIKTLTVRGDQPDPAAQPVAGAPPAPAKPAPAARASAAPRSPANANANASTANAPLSLAPQGAEPAPAAEPRTRVTATTTSPVQNPSSAGASGGGYLVQVSSQRNEADAQASYKALQGKFPAVLGSRAPLIKRADLGGDKGVYYRAMVGPFGSPDEASQFCGSLKTAGGQCVVQRN